MSGLVIGARVRIGPNRVWPDLAGHVGRVQALTPETKKRRRQQGRAVWDRVGGNPIIEIPDRGRYLVHSADVTVIEAA
jgi:hypothetical protein